MFQATVDQELLWNPRHGNYSDWLTNLTTTLMGSGAVKDELLRLLEPVCHRKVSMCVPFIMVTINYRDWLTTLYFVVEKLENISDKAP